MPRGVTDQFLKILKNERKGNVRAAVTAAVLSVFAYFMAELTDEPLLGHVVLVAVLALAAGGVAGALYGRHQTRKYNDSLRDSWNAWMRMSLSCTSVDEVASHVAAKRRLPQLAGVGWGAMLLLNGLLFAFLWVEVAWATTFGLAVTTVNGLALGALAGHALWSFRWAAQFNQALDEMISEGQVGLWGEV